MLTRAIFSEGCKSVAAGMNPMDLRRGINLAVEKVLEDLKSRAKMISTTEEIAQVRPDFTSFLIACEMRKQLTRRKMPLGWRLLHALD